MSTQLSSDRPKKVTIQTVQAMKERGEKISMLTAYDYTMARIIDRAGMDIMLVGDSAGNVMAGYETTLPVKLEHMLYHTACVSKGTDRALVIADLPFMSYQLSPEQALQNAGRFMKEAGAQGIKLEGGRSMGPAVQKITAAGIPVVGHLGLTPQSVNKFGGYGLRAKEEAEASELLDDAQALEEAGCFALVLEKIPAPLAARVTDELSIPTIGIGAGAQCDGQVLVMQDMLGLNNEFKPKFLRRYADLESTVSNAVKQYIKDIKLSAFPSQDEQYE